MDNILPQLLSFPPQPAPLDPLSDIEYDKQIKAIVQTLSTISANKLTGGMRGGGDLLDILNPSINTLPYLYVLLAHISTSSSKQSESHSLSKNFTPNQPLWQKMMEFMERFDPVQIRYGGHEIRRLIDLTAMRAGQLRQPAVAISPIRTAILRIDPTRATFTSAHLLLCQICLEARAYVSALPVLERDISFLPTSSAKQTEAAINILSPYLCSNHESSSNYINSTSGISNTLVYQDYLLYFLYGGMIYMALKSWERALFFLEIVIGAPAPGIRDGSAGVSKIQSEAFKKWVLVGLLFEGHIPRTPKNVSSLAMKTYQSLGKAYVALAEAFNEGIKNEESDSRLIEEARYGHACWKEDFNEGLVKQVVGAYRRFSVQHLENIYTALTVADVTRRTSPDPNDYTETANYLAYLISMGQLNASISESSEGPMTRVVRFNSFTGARRFALSESQQLEGLKRQTYRNTLLTDHVREADRQFGVSKEYIQEVKKAKKLQEGGQGGEETMAGEFSLHSDVFSQDEDMMADL